MDNPNQLLKNTRHSRKLTLREMAAALGVSFQRIAQWEGGQPIPSERIRAWTQSEQGWIRAMAFQLWLAGLWQEYEHINQQIAGAPLFLQGEL